MTVATIAARYYYYHGRILSTDGYVGSFTPPSGMPKIQDITGPFSTRPVRRDTGYEEVGQLTFLVWGERDLVALISEIHNQGSGQKVSAWGIVADTIGNDVDLITSYKVEIKPKTEPGEIVAYEVTVQPVANGLEHGVVVHAMGEESGDGDTESSSVDNGASSASGGAGYLQVAALNRDSGDDLTVTLRDSPDDAVWSDLQAFTAITTDYADDDPDNGTAERIEISGTIERYAACDWVFGGTPGGNEDATFQVALVRN